MTNDEQKIRDMINESISDERVAIAKRMLEPDIQAIARVTGLKEYEVERLYMYQIGMIGGEAIGRLHGIVQIAKADCDDAIKMQARHALSVTDWEWDKAKEFIGE